MTIKDCIKREMILHLEEKPGILPGTATRTLSLHHINQRKNSILAPGSDSLASDLFDMCSPGKLSPWGNDTSEMLYVPFEMFPKKGSSLSHEQDWCHLPFAAWSCSRNSPSCNVELSGLSSRKHLTSYLLHIFSYNHWIWANSMTLHQPERKLGFVVSLIDRSTTSTCKWVKWRILSVGDPMRPWARARFSPIPNISWLSNSLLNTNTYPLSFHEFNNFLA